MGKKKKVQRQSTIIERDEEASSSRDDTACYQQKVKDLVKQIEVQNMTIRAVLESYDKRDSEPTRSNANANHESCTEHSKFSFADIENSLNTFSGQDNYSIYQWVHELESAASVFGWSELQKVVFGKRLLTGTAKLAIRSQDNLNTWGQLKRFLCEEFKEKSNSALIHEQLRKRRKLPNETFRDYLLSICELGNRANLEEPALIKYAIDGIIDDERNKVILYGALAEFKEKLAEYESFLERVRARFRPTNAPRNRRRPEISDRFQSKCFRCGRIGHVASNCPVKEQGNKCFACNQYGHKSSECPTKRRQGDRQEIALMKEPTIMRNDMCKTILVNNVATKAFVDTGSDLTFMREDKY